MSENAWFQVEEYPNRIIKIAEPGHRHRLNSYLVEGGRDIAVIDAGMGFGDFVGVASPLSNRNPIVLLTHAHWDHAGAAHRYNRVLVHPAEADDLRNGTPNKNLRRWFDDKHLFGVSLPADLDPSTRCIPGVEPTGLIDEGDSIDLGGRALEVFHTPGHSTGSVTFVDRQARAMFTGDAVYAGSMLCNFSGTDPIAYRTTLRKLACLAADLDLVYPAHMQAPIDASEVIRYHEAYEAIWTGEVQPTITRRGTDIFRFDGFAFWLSSGTYGGQK